MSVDDRTLKQIAASLREQACCINAGNFAPCVDCLLMIEAAAALEKIDATVGIKLRRAITP